MDRLLEELTGQGLLGTVEAEWASSYAHEQQISLDGALLELDLVDEESLLRALRSSTGGASASPADLLEIDPESARTLPERLARSFFMCPLRRTDNRVVALVEKPLADESVQELKDVFRIVLDQRVAPAHYLSLARERVYGVEAGERAHALEARLARRRIVEGVADVLGRWQGAVSLSAALDDVLRFATDRVEYACFFARHGETLRVLTPASDGQAKSRVVALPDRECSLFPALAHGGCFLGLLSSAEADRRFYATLDRPPPRWACVIPAPVASTTSLTLHCDNGSRGIATRWGAELALLVSRVGQRGGSRSETRASNSRPPGRASARPAPDVSLSAPTPWSTPPAPEVYETTPAAPSASEVAPAAPSAPLAAHPASTAPAAALAPELTPLERSVLGKLRRASADANLPLDAFVDSLLATRPAPRAPELAEASMLVGEVKGFFERLATEIPAQLARGMEAAFRDMAPRVAAASPPGLAAPPAMGAAPPPPRPSASADIELVRVESAARDVGSYQAKRRKAERVKL